MAEQAPLLISVVELGGYPDFSALYRELGYRVETLNSGRKANSTVKRLCPAVVVSEFNPQSSFRDRTSTLESLLAVAQHNNGVRIIVFHHPEVLPLLQPLQQRFPGFYPLPYPIDEQALSSLLEIEN